MPKIDVLDMEGKRVGEVELSDAVFGVEMNKHVVYQVVRAQLANKRQGTQSALTRAEVSGGGKKPWRQKGTGRARQGSTRSPQWRHGGVVFAPKPRDYSISVPRKVRRLALKCALSDKVTSSQMIVLNELTLAQPKTREMVKVLKNLDADKKVLLVLGEKSEAVEAVQRASSNLQNVKTAYCNTLNVLDILGCDRFIIVKDALAQVEEVYAS
jgi:large subunit ribosomal protein L4